MHHDIVVVKLGESSLGKSKDLKNTLPKIIDFLSHLQKQNKQIILLASALSGHSRKIKKIVENLSPNHQNDYNNVFCHAEFFSCNLIETYINQSQLKSKALIFEQTPIHLQKNNNEWEIDTINQNLISQCLTKNIIPIIPGFIGHSKQCGYQAMSFDCSDVSAVHLAHLYNAEQCIFLKNPGPLYICNPKMVKEAKIISNLDYEQLKLFSKNTSPVIHEKAIQYAQDHQIKLFLTSPVKKNLTTEIHTNLSNNQSLIGILYQQQINGLYKIIVVGNPNNKPKETFKVLQKNTNLSHIKFIFHKHSTEIHDLTKSDLKQHLNFLYQQLS
ncbi:MAG TPA: hypothetical protein PKC21_00775 [Oligoflexia bacterium]|nr:hypothetical protein [Oligoflexia bacterium]HMR23862.1 hypothetical protein [Oligoflexia bacterium]